MPNRTFRIETIHSASASCKYISSIASAYFFSITLRFALRVGVISPSSILKGFRLILKLLIRSNLASSFEKRLMSWAIQSLISLSSINRSGLSKNASSKPNASCNPSRDGITKAVIYSRLSPTRKDSLDLWDSSGRYSQPG